LDENFGEIDAGQNSKGYHAIPAAAFDR